MPARSSSGPAAPVPYEDALWRRSFRRKLLAWYARAARDLPWRQLHDPYAIWVSEIMLQQTQVETVKGYFNRFIQRFPTIASLSRATEAEVLREWEGLGYYRRARQMHAAARQMMTQHAGQFPDELTEVMALPGIGRYTAGAILSICFDRRLPVLEANTVRLLARLAAYPDDPTKAAGQRALWEMATAVLPRSNCGTFNQALMELGSLVCAARQPACAQCPVADLCAARQLGQEQKIPLTKGKMNYEQVTEVALVVRRGTKVVLRQCGTDERWAGLWDFPRYGIAGTAVDRAHDSLVRQARQQTGLELVIDDRLVTIKHGVTKYRITLHCLAASVQPGGRLRKPARWVALRDLDHYPLSVTGRKIAGLIQA